MGPGAARADSLGGAAGASAQAAWKPAIMKTFMGFMPSTGFEVLTVELMAAAGVEVGEVYTCGGGWSTCLPVTTAVLRAILW